MAGNVDRGDNKAFAWALLVTYVVSRAIFAFAGFKYNIYSDGFKLDKVAIDFGTWLGLYAISFFIIQRRFKGEKR